MMNLKCKKLNNFSKNIRNIMPNKKLPNQYQTFNNFIEKICMSYKLESN